MSDPLNPYPGNLKRHEVVDDTDLEVLILRTNDMEGLQYVRDIYEASRAKDAELIQMAVGLASNAPHGNPEVIRIACEMFLAAAEAHGFKPTEP